MTIPKVLAPALFGLFLVLAGPGAAEAHSRGGRCQPVRPVVAYVQYYDVYEPYDGDVDDPYRPYGRSLRAYDYPRLYGYYRSHGYRPSYVRRHHYHGRLRCYRPHVGLSFRFGW